MSSVKVFIITMQFLKLTALSSQEEGLANDL